MKKHGFKLIFWFVKVFETYEQMPAKAYERFAEACFSANKFKRLFALFACIGLNAQVLIDSEKKEPALIARSRMDTTEGEYLTESGIYRGFIVRKSYKVAYSANEAHNGIEYSQVVVVLDDKKKQVKNVIGCRVFEYVANEFSIKPLNIWRFNQN